MKQERFLKKLELPKERAHKTLSFVASKEERVEYLSKNSTAEISVTIDRPNRNKADFIFSYTRQPIYEGGTTDEIYIDWRDENGHNYEGLRFDTQTTKFRKEEDYQLMARSIKKAASILSDWDASVADQPVLSAQTLN